jgi:hypothetical protein
LCVWICVRRAVYCVSWGRAYGVVGEGELDEGDQRREPLQLCAAGGGVGGRLSTCGASAARRERASDRNSKKRVRQRRRRWHEDGGGAQMKRRAEVCVCVGGGHARDIGDAVGGEVEGEQLGEGREVAQRLEPVVLHPHLPQVQQRRLIRARTHAHAHAHAHAHTRAHKRARERARAAHTHTHTHESVIEGSETRTMAPGEAAL